MIRSTFRDETFTLIDNRMLWELFDILRKNGYKVNHEYSRVSPGNKIIWECYPYPTPKDLEKIKNVTSKIASIAKEGTCS